MGKGFGYMRRKYMRRKTPRLGQHLLTNSAIAAAVADAAGVGPKTRVFEVGPGIGILTHELLKRGALVSAVEKDPKMLEVLNARFPEEIARGQLVLMSGDAREITPDAVFPTGAYVIAANIPYYITGELIRIFLTAHNQPQCVSLLVQKEVAERIARSKKESILSLSVKAYGIPRLARSVSRGNFAPPPKVDSAILSITDISRHAFKTVSEENFFTVLKAGFGQKRKALAGNLMRTFGSSYGVLPGVRAEDVTLTEWLRIAKLT